MIATERRANSVISSISAETACTPTGRRWGLPSPATLAHFNELLAKAERGYLPLTWRWDLRNLAPGEHVLTVNISSFAGQVGVRSVRIRRRP